VLLEEPPTLPINVAVPGQMMLAVVVSIVRMGIGILAVDVLLTMIIGEIRLGVAAPRAPTLERSRA
jgi:hypothetical protein